MNERTSRLSGTSRNFLALAVGNYGAMAVALGTSVLLARRLGTENYGRLALMLLASQVLLMLSVNWSHVGFIRFGSREFAANGVMAETLWTRLGLLLPSAGLGMVAMAIGRQPLATYLGIPEAGIWLILLHFVGACALSLVSGILQASQQMTRYGVCLFLDKAVMLACIALLPAARTADPLFVLGCYAASSLLVAVWAVSVVGRARLRPLLPSRGAYRAMIVYSAPLLLTTWAGLFGTNWFDLVILKWYVPISELGVYSLATQLAGVVQQVTVIFSTLVLPTLSVMVANGENERITVFLERLLPYWLLGTSVLFSLVLIGARAGLTLVFGESFAGAAPALALFMVATSGLALFNACAPLVNAYGANWVVTAISFEFGVANLALDLLFIPRLGIVGSALATAIAYASAAVLLLAFLQRKSGSRVLRLAWLAGPVLAACACFLLLDGFWFYPAALSAVAASVVALIATFRIFRDEDAVYLEQLHVPMPFGLGQALKAVTPWR
jgi:O-antigen/teichoic acid export membrane protein